MLNDLANNVSVIAAMITGPGQSFQLPKSKAPLSVGVVNRAHWRDDRQRRRQSRLHRLETSLCSMMSMAVNRHRSLASAAQAPCSNPAASSTPAISPLLPKIRPSLTGLNNNVGTIAAEVTGLNQGFTFAQATGFAVGSVAGIDGITTNNGLISLSAKSGNITFDEECERRRRRRDPRRPSRPVGRNPAAVWMRPAYRRTRSPGSRLAAAIPFANCKASNSGTGGITFNNSSPGLNVTGLTAAGPGSIFLQTSGNLTISGVASTESGSIALGSGGLETINAAVAAGPSGSVMLTSSSPSGDVVVNANVSAASGEIIGTAGRNFILNAGNLTASGAVRLTAGSGEIHEAGTGVIKGSSLSTNSAAGTDLQNINLVSSFSGIDGFGGIQFVGPGSLLTVTGITEGGGDVAIKNAGSITASGPLTAGGGISLAATGPASNVFLNAVVSAGGSLQVTTPADVFFAVNDKAGAINVAGQIIEAAGNLTATSGDLALNAADTLYLEGATYSGANVLLNANLPQPRIEAPQASIILTNTKAVTIDAGKIIRCWRSPKNLLAFGSLTINAKDATIGDTAAHGALDIAADKVTLLDRQPDGSSFDGRHDQGLSIVADSIDFGGASLSFSGQGNGKAFFSVGSGLPNVNQISGTTFYVDAEVDDQFQQTTGDPNGNFPAGGAISPVSLPLQPIAGGVIDAEVVAVLAGSLPSIKFSDPSPEIRLSAAAVKKFTGLGVNSRDPDAEEKKGLKARRALFKQLFKTLHPDDSDYQVVVNRIAAGQVYKVLDTYNRIVGENLELVPKIKDAFSGQYAKYVGNGDVIDASGFGDYLVAHQKKDAQARDALAIIGQVRELFTELGRIGLTTKEVEICQDVIWRSLDIDDFTEADFFSTSSGSPHRQFAPPPRPGRSSRRASGPSHDCRNVPLRRVASATMSCTCLAALLNALKPPWGELPALTPFRRRFCNSRRWPAAWRPERARWPMLLSQRNLRRSPASVYPLCRSARACSRRLPRPPPLPLRSRRTSGSIRSAPMLRRN